MANALSVAVKIVKVTLRHNRSVLEDGRKKKNRSSQIDTEPQVKF